jgi:hypothetical protein
MFGENYINIDIRRILIFELNFKKMIKQKY